MNWGALAAAGVDLEATLSARRAWRRAARASRGPREVPLDLEALLRDWTTPPRNRPPGLGEAESFLHSLQHEVDAAEVPTPSGKQVATASRSSRTTSGGSTYDLEGDGVEYCGNCLDDDDDLQHLVDRCNSLGYTSITVECSVRDNGSCDCNLTCCNPKGVCRGGSVDPTGCVREERPYENALDVTPGPDDAPLGADSLCRVQVAARDFPEDAGKGMHCYFILTDPNGMTYAIHGNKGGRGCPQGCNWGKDFGCIVTYSSPTNGITDNKSDWAPVTVASGLNACLHLPRIEEIALAIHAARVPYCVSGPNSNSVVGTILRALGLPEEYPAARKRFPLGFYTTIAY